MQIRCECGEFRAELTGFPKNTPGRLACYCNDCQAYLHYLKRSDLLDSAGGTEVVPVYPSEFKFVSGVEHLRCTRLSPNGLHRWSTACCNTPIANTRPGFPWVGILHRPYNVVDPRFLEKTLGQIRSRIHGRFASATPPEGTSDKIRFRDALVVMPFLLKGFLLGKQKSSPFFKPDGSPIVEPQVVPREERERIEASLKK